MSKNKSYLEQIDDLIVHHRHELELLEAARQVVARLASPTAKPAAEAPKADEAPSITIRRVSPPAPKAKPAAEKGIARGRGSPRRVAEKAVLRDKILSELAKAPLKSAELIQRFAPPNPDKAERQVVYAMMYDLKRLGTVVHDEESLLYSLPKGETASHATSH